MSDFIEPLDYNTPNEAKELRALVRSLSFAEGFTLLLAQCSPSKGRHIMASLYEKMPGQKVQEITFNDSVENLLDEVALRLSDPIPDAVFINGLENSFSHDANPRAIPIIANLNAARNSFPRIIQCPLVLWVPSYVLNAISQGAPDFFSIRSGVYFFEGAEQTTVTLNQSLNKEFEPAIYSLPLSEKIEVLNKIQILLEDYSSLPDDQRDYYSEMNLLIHQGNVLHSLGRFHESIRAQEQSLQIAREIKSQNGEAVALISIGQSYESLGKIPPARELFEQALKIAIDIGDEDLRSNALNNLGSIYYSSDEIPPARELLEQALKIAKNIDDIGGKLSAIGNLGNIYRDLGEIERAKSMFEQALKIAIDIGDRNAESISLDNLGNIYESLGEIQRGIDFHQKALNIAEEVGNKSGVCVSLINLGADYHALGDNETAKALHERALMIAQEIGNQIRIQMITENLRTINKEN